jgi:hypothetical protein
MSSPNYGRHVMNHDLPRFRLVCRYAACMQFAQTNNPTIKPSPCHLAFNQDMIFYCAVQIDWNSIRQERQKSLAASNEKENRFCIEKHYSPDDKVLIVLDSDERYSQPKINTPTKAPFTVTRVHNNGTVDINRGNFT